MSKKLTLATLILLIPFMFSHAQLIPLKDYESKNSDEQAILDILETLSNAMKIKDKKQILSLCHKKVKFLDSSGKYISRDQMMRTDVSEWGPPGNALQAYNDVKILINENYAAVNLQEKRSDGFYTVNIQFVNILGKWLIIRHEWQPYKKKNSFSKLFG
jgi:hypothetical protein